MAKLSMKLKQQREPKFSTRAYTRCRLCAVRTAYCAATASAVSASANWPTRARSPASARRAGKKEVTT